MRARFQLNCAFSIILSLAGMPGHGHATETLPCVSIEEAHAFNVRSLQSQFMVAALACNQREAYNRFVSHFRSYLKIANAELVSYFSRIGRGRSAVNAHVTDLANAAGLRRAESPASYCTRTWNLFWALEHDPRDLAKAATANHMPSMPRPPVCALRQERPSDSSEMP